MEAARRQQRVKTESGDGRGSGPGRRRGPRLGRERKREEYGRGDFARLSRQGGRRPVVDR